MSLFVMNDALKREWDKPDAVYVLDAFLEKHRYCKKYVPRKEFAALVQEAWVLFNDSTLELIRTTLLFSKKRRALVKSIDGIPRHALETRQGICNNMILEHTTNARLVFLKDKLLDEQDNLYRTLESARHSGVLMLKKMSTEQISLMYGFFFVKWETCSSQMLQHIEKLICQTHSMSLLYNLLEYMKPFISS